MCSFFFFFSFFFNDTATTEIYTLSLHDALPISYRRAAAMTVLVEPFASVYDDRSRLGVILARGRSGFEGYAADDHSLGLFPSPRKAAAAITTTRPWVAVSSKLLARADEVIE